MNFINKLIKRGVFGLIVCFSFFVLFNGIKVEAAVCNNPSVSIDDEYLVITPNLNWKDTGVSITCDGVPNNGVTVKVNNEPAVATTNSGLGVADRYVSSPGFYKIQYYLTGNSDVSVTRYVRVLNSKLNNDRNLWISDSITNSEWHDSFTKVIDTEINGESGYIAVGNFSENVEKTEGSVTSYSTTGFVAAFNNRGEMVWINEITGPSGTTYLNITNIVKATNTNYYISGQYIVGTNTYAFVQSIELNEGGDSGLSSLVSGAFEITTGFSEMDVVNEMVVSGNYVYAVGYKTTNSVKRGVIVRVDNRTNYIYTLNSTKTLSSEYNSVIRTIDNNNIKIVAVGSTSVEGYTGATGGIITECVISNDNGSNYGLNCETNKIHLYQNSNLASSTITKFNSIVSHENGYIIVGQSRVDKVTNRSNATVSGSNNGVEDGLILYLNTSFEIVDAELVGGRYTDILTSIKQIDAYNYIAVGEEYGSGYYTLINVKNSVLTVTANDISSNFGNVTLNDVFVKFYESTGESYYVFVGASNATVDIEGIVVNNQGGNDALFAILDNTRFTIDESFNENYSNISIKQNTIICSGDLKSCSGDQVLDVYKLNYGTTKYAFPSGSIISSETVGEINTYHGFTNSQGIIFKIGRIIGITEKSTAANLEDTIQGIDKWYLYSRPTYSGNNVIGIERKETWNNYYYPVEDGQKKEEDTIYFVLNGTKGFIVDTSTSTTTFSNYIMLFSEFNKLEDGLTKETGETYYVWDDENEKYIVDTSTSTTTSSNYILTSVEEKTDKAAFQSIEKAKEFAMLQEYTRIAFVPEKYNYVSSNYTTRFSGEVLDYQNYYYVYYIDLSFGNGECKMINLEITGDCSNYRGYAFASLSSIKKVAEAIVKNETRNYFVTEANGEFNYNNSSIYIPKTTEFKEELTTIKYFKTYSRSLGDDQVVLEVKYYEPNGNTAKGYSSYKEPVTYLYTRDSDKDSAKYTIVSKNSVDFSASGEISKEGKFEVRYCYDYDADTHTGECGTSTTFVIDRTAPVINYELYSASVGQFVIAPEVILITTNFDVTSIVDLDPYAYTIVDGKIVYLTCNKAINSTLCKSDYDKYVLRKFEHDKTNPDKIFNIQVHDRAGNSLSVNFKIGAAAPSLIVDSNESSDKTFTLTIDFYNKNPIDGMMVKYTKSQECTTCASSDAIRDMIKEYLDAVVELNNRIIAKKYEAQTMENPYDPSTDEEIVKSIVLTFTETTSFENGLPTTGLVLPEILDTTAEEETEPEVLFAATTLTITQGLYQFAITDTFYNSSSTFGGIGITKTELDVYVSDDANYNDRELFANNGSSSLLIPAISNKDNPDENPMKYGYAAVEDGLPKEEGVTYYILDGEGKYVVDESENTTTSSNYVEKALTFMPTTPNKYAYDIPEELDNAGFNNEIYFSNQFIYVRFKNNSYSKITINRATKISSVGNYIFNDGGSETESSVQLFTFCGTTLISNGTCSERNGEKELSTSGFGSVQSILSSEGIYVLVDGEYFVLVFTKDGTYLVSNEVISNDLSEVQVQEPSDVSFSIDSSAPIITGSVLCENGSGCTGVNQSYESGYTTSDSIREYNLGNIGNYSFIFNLSDEKFKYIDDSNEEASVINRLLVFTKDGATYDNAYAYSLSQQDKTGATIVFRDNGAYTITFVDAHGNTVTFKFVISKETPQITEVSSAGDKTFSEYQQYADVRISISEDTFLEKDEGENASNMLFVEYWLEYSGAPTNKDIKKIYFTNEMADGKCVIGEGTGNIKGVYDCALGGSEGARNITVNFVVRINEDRKISGEVNLYVRATDYFGNSVTSDPITIRLDNNSPYIYFSNEYTPTKNFGTNVSSDESKKWLEINGDSSLVNFVCTSKDGTFGELLNGKILCGDMPEIDNVSNNITIQAYEVSRVAYNNYILTNNGYDSINDGYVDFNTQLYKYVKTYARFSNIDELTNTNKDIYKVGKYTQVEATDLIDPNVIYYYEDEGEMEEVSINDMYSTSTYSSYTNISECSTQQCILYRMYIDSGNFAANKNFYTYDSSEYTKIDKDDIDTTVTDYYKYYYYLTGEDYVVDSGKYLPAVTLANSCVSYDGGNCVSIPANRIKLKDTTLTYYNIITQAKSDATFREITMSDGTKTNAIVDDRIWQIAVDENGKKVSFGFGLASVTGRPIIFAVTDGAGNIGSTQLETVIKIKDVDNPVVKDISSLSFEVDTRGYTTTYNNYVKVTKYYRVYDTNNISCADASTTYYAYDTSKKEYSSVVCGEWKTNTRYYAGVDTYELLEDGLDKEEGKTYYIASINKLTNYLTSENLLVTFNEHIYKVECEYYVGGIENSETKKCSFDNTTFEYFENKTQFSLVFEREGEYYVNYKLIVYDFSGNATIVNYLFIDRQKPVIIFRDDSYKETIIEVDYSSSQSNSTYNENYLKDAENGNENDVFNYKDEVVASDSVNNRINTLNALVSNNLTYTVVYKKYNYNVTFNNYELDNNGKFKSVENGKPKNGNTYYVLLQNNGLYNLRGNTGIDADGSTCDVGDYCYVIDSYNYYPSLLTNDDYWENVDIVSINEVGVYKVEYFVKDQSGNISSTIIKTIYVVDRTAPNIEIEGSEDSESTKTDNDPSNDVYKYGYHNWVTIRVSGEKEAMMYIYTCKETNLDAPCELPSYIIESTEGSDLSSPKPESITGNFDRTYNSQGIFKIYFQDLGSYINSSIYFKVDGEESGQIFEVKTLMYNYDEYQFLIDREDPKFYLEAKVDSNDNKLYYEARLTQEEYLYCVYNSDRNKTNLAFGNTKDLCQNLLGGTSSIKTNNNGTITQSIYDSETGKILSEKTYKEVTGAKYFYNTYYWKNGNSFEAYKFGEAYNKGDGVVYMIETIKLYFRDDGSYLIRAQDRAGNKASRVINASYPTAKEIAEVESNSSFFVIDNTAPTYNKDLHTPTGVNYWYSVPSAVINSSNMSNISSITGETNGYYDIFANNSTLNTAFFYAFATRGDAYEYLYNLYSVHINAQEESGSCFYYPYYDAIEKRMVTGDKACFVAKTASTNKGEALNTIMSRTLSGLIYPTFSGNTLFKNTQGSEIKQSSVDQNMYKYVYLKTEKIESTNTVTTQVSETCEASSADSVVTECIKINVKIVQYMSANKVDFKLGADNSNDPDSSQIVIYSLEKTKDETTGEIVNKVGSSIPYTTSGSINLDKTNTYYVFVERDEVITYDSYLENNTSSVSHYNVTYYAIYVDDTYKLKVYSEDDNGRKNTNLVSTEGNGYVETNDDVYYLIIENIDNDPEFNNKYEIVEIFDEKGKLSEVYSYLRLVIGGIAYNINDYIVKTDAGYYFRIPIVHTVMGLGERVVSVTLTDRAGVTTLITISHTQIAPNIELTYYDDHVNIKINESNISSLEKGENDFKVYYSKTGEPGSYSMTNTENLRNALLCKSDVVYFCEIKSINGKNVYSMTLNNAENLFGFFRVELIDNHGNPNSIEFIYNYDPLIATYSSTAYYGLKYISTANDLNNPRMITNGDLILEWNNEFNYVILYKDGRVVCNTKEHNYLNDGTCLNEKGVIKAVYDQNDKYEKSVITYSEEGMYSAEIYNRQSEIINARCFVSEGNGNFALSEDCKSINSYSNNPVCSWDSNYEYCIRGLQVVSNTVSKLDNNYSYVYLEIDKTAPVIDESNFAVTHSTGPLTFEKNENDLYEYTNVLIDVTWEGKDIILEFSCTYGENVCSNKASFFDSVRIMNFKARGATDTTYEVWLLDYAGNKTESIIFTIKVKLPVIQIFEIKDDGSEAVLESGQKTKNNVVLKCYEIDQVDCGVYTVNAYVNSSPYTGAAYGVDKNGYGVYTFKEENKYNKIDVYVPIDNSLSAWTSFEIDKTAPTIDVKPSVKVNNSYNIYKDSVTISINDVLGTFNIYENCEIVDSAGISNKYSCSEEPKYKNIEGSKNIELSETGIYKVVAVDDVGNVTNERQIKYINIDNDSPTITVIGRNDYLDFNVSENGYTNAPKIIVTSIDNRENSYLRYRMKAANGAYIINENTDAEGWITITQISKEFEEEGFYEVQSVDVVGNKSMERHFIVYRQAPVYDVDYDKGELTNSRYFITKGEFKLTWEDSTNELVAPIIKVTMNGETYLKNTKISKTGEYLFVLVDLAGNIATHKVMINTSENVCLDNVNINPNAKFFMPVSEDYMSISLSGDKGYAFKENDVIILATPTSYYRGSSACGSDAISYQSLLNKESYLLVTQSLANSINSRLEDNPYNLRLSEREVENITELGGYVYVFVVDKDVAKNDLGFAFENNFFVKDPIGWTFIFAGVVLVVYVTLKLTIFRKKVKVLKG